MVEVKPFIGLLYRTVNLRSNRQSLEQLWEHDGDGIDIFRLTLSMMRYKFILRCLRFDGMSTKAPNDQLAPTEDIFSKFVNNYQGRYCLGENFIIDEKLESFC